MASPAIMSGASPGLPPQAAGGMAPQGDPMSDAVGLIRAVADASKAMGAGVPALASVAAQIEQLLKQALVQAAQQASMQTASSQAVPMGG